MKKIVGVKMIEGSILPVEYDLQYCICIKRTPYKEPIVLTYGWLPKKEEEVKYFEENKQYEFVVENDGSVINNHLVYINGNSGTNLTKEEFDERFIEITEYRNYKIESIL